MQQNLEDYAQCPVYTAPIVAKGMFRRSVGFLRVFVGLLPYRERVLSFIGMERTTGRSWGQILKNLYTNAHLLKADLDWLHFGFATMALQSEYVAKAIGAQMAVSCRGFDMDVYPLKHHGCYDLLWQQVDKLHPISDYMYQKAVALGYAKDRAFQIITPAVELKENGVSKKVVSETLKLLTVARLHWIKGLEDILIALALLKQAGYQFEYKIIGKGELKESLLYAIHQLGLVDCVELMDALPHAKVLEILQHTDIYIQYSLSEGFCNAVLEAQAAGCLCVVSDGGGLPENILHEETGWVVPKRQPKLLFETLEGVIKALSTTEAQEVRYQAIRRLKETFNLSKQQDEFNKFYQ
ncbi:glycosyltransferase family 4 protein [Mangrovimonas sp. TPBH4]|uniref:glycosyltransferase family 4 protein n=1 Tax=Mangrovimonas sp. TPBH4 TaxID=1645914 RepID=UPI0012FCB870|nr:glycosyltransferase family 4 protein [Mangrovimonas sp. TPBH4]